MELVKSTLQEALLDAGCDAKTADTVAVLLEAGLREEAYQALTAHRKGLLAAVHEEQKASVSGLSTLLLAKRSGGGPSMVKPLVMLLLCLLPFSMGACAASSHPEGSPSLSAPVPSAPPSAASSPMPQPSAAQPVQIQIQVGDSILSAILADNPSAKAFADLLAQGPVTVEMADYGGFEKVGPLPTALVQNNEDITTQPGDLILYQGQQVVIYYGENSYSLTRLGRIDGISQQDLMALLGPADVRVTFSFD